MSGEIEKTMGYKFAGKPSTERTARLKARCRWKHAAAGEFVNEDVRVGIERMRYLTEAHQKTYGMPEVMRRALALENILKNMTVVIQEDELIVGEHAENPNYIPLYPELTYHGTLDLVEDYMPEEHKEEAMKILEYWKPFSLQLRAESYFSPEELRVAYSSVITQPPPFIANFSNCVPSYQSVMEDGLLGRIQKCEEQINMAMQKLHDSTSAWNADEKLPLLDKIDLWRAMIIADKAVITWARRYSRLARIIAEHFEKDPQRKEELLQIADICWRVPAEPCKGFWDSMQAKWFVYVVAQSLERYSSGFSQKEDRLHWPYYKASVIDKTFQPMTREQAVELVECERLKVSERGTAKGRQTRLGLPGTNDLHILTIGGLNENNEDDCNELTDVILEAANNIRTPEPSIGFRWHPKGNLETKRKVFNCIASGLGFPSIKHEELNYRQLTEIFKAPHSEARNWALVLCMSPGVAGRRATQKTRAEGGFDVYTAKCMELALSDGYDYSVLNMQVGPHTGDPTKFKSIEEVYEALKKQVEHAVYLMVKYKDISRLLEVRYLECPFISSLDDACVEKGIGGNALKDQPNPWFNYMFIINCVDSLAAMKKLIFEEKKYTMEELIKALRANWEGYEEMRRDFLAAPKWGNDDPYVDEIAVRVYNDFHEIATRHTVYSGVPILPLGQTVSMFAALAPLTGALPCGKKHGEALSDGGISPYTGMDKKGPTAVLKSVSKVDASKYKGMQLNQRLSHALMNSDKGFEIWLAYMNTWYDLNIDHVQFNVVRTEDMRAAQKEPEKYEDLIVRIAGYSARFISLPKLAQDAIIARTEQQFA